MKKQTIKELKAIALEMGRQDYKEGRYAACHSKKLMGLIGDLERSGEGWCIKLLSDKGWCIKLLKAWSKGKTLEMLLQTEVAA